MAACEKTPSTCGYGAYYAQYLAIQQLPGTWVVQRDTARASGGSGRHRGCASSTLICPIAVAWWEISGTIGHTARTCRSQHEGILIGEAAALCGLPASCTTGAQR